jgi:acyl-CoA reductase-like NAD-dependent aldehyde dehydrogenase
MRSYQLYIDGQDCEGDGWNYTVRASAFLTDPVAAFELKRALELGEKDPADAPPEVVARCAWSGDEANDRALAAAARASKEFARIPRDVRHQIGNEFHDGVSAHAEELVEILIVEGHPRRLAEWEIRGVLEATAPESIAWYFEQLHQEVQNGSRRVVLARKPDGVVCLNPPQNAAGSNSALGVGPLLAGNTLVVKAPRSTPLSVMFLYRDIVAPILERHGAPAGTLNIISGDSKRILRQWTRSPVVDDIMFFGDSNVGLKVGNECVTNGKKAILELSGNDGIVIWDDADLDAASAAMTECFYGSSQICMVPKYAIAHPAIAEELIERLLERVSGIRPGYPEDPEVVLSPVLKADRFFDFLDEARESGAAILSGGRRVDVNGEESPMALFFEPTVVRVDGLQSARELRCVREETFFPMLPVIVPDADGSESLLDQVVDFVNANEYGLRNSFWAADPGVIDAFAEQVTNGGLLKINESHIGFTPTLATHGGTGKTGGPYGELHYPVLRTSHLQGISIAPSGSCSAEELLAQVSLPSEAPA